VEGSMERAGFITPGGTEQIRFVGTSTDVVYLNLTNGPWDQVINGVTETLAPGTLHRVSPPDPKRLLATMVQTEPIEDFIGAPLAENHVLADGDQHVIIGGEVGDTITLEGAGSHVVLAGPGADVVDASSITGTSGRQILVGGDDGDQLLAGPNGDILVTGGLDPWLGFVTGTTDEVRNSYPQYVDALRLVWVSETNSFADRVDKLFVGFGDRDFWSSNPLGNAPPPTLPVRLSHNHTSNVDNVVNDLFGDDVTLGSGLDWLFQDSALDILSGPPLDTEESTESKELD